MVLKKQTLSTLIFSLFFIINISAQIKDLQHWLKTPENKRTSLDSLDFAKHPLTKNQAEIATKLLLADKQASILSRYSQQWDDRVLEIKDLKMPFYFQLFGKKPDNGRSLFISLHGGGGAPAHVNDQQYNNQKHLYDVTMKTQKGVYMALRAPTNTWDLWHQDHIDDFLNIIIQLAVIKEEVNPNKVYILGYSAGGDGLYQLAPRMADRWASASMMAGHPGDASALNLRNTPFAIHMGALDDAYKRNELAKQWGVVLDSLSTKNPYNYIHNVQIHKGLGHWMKLKDAAAIPWMKQYERNPIPKKVTWKQDNRHHNSFYWLATPKNLIKTNGDITVEYNSKRNEINIINSYTNGLELYINDNMLNLDKPITIKREGEKIYKGVFNRSIFNIYKTLATKGDKHLAFSSIIHINKITKK